MDKPTNTQEVICAVSTPPGIGGIAVIRVSGNNAISITQKLWKGRNLDTVGTHTAHLGHIVDKNNEIIDQAVATVFRAPKSFTGQNTVELAVHGSIYVQKTIVEALINAGARLAEPGEFTRRAFMSGRIDLTQAEAVADILNARTKSAHRLAMKQMRGNVSKKTEQLRNQLLELAVMLELELDFSEEDVEFANRNDLREKAQNIYAHIRNLLNTYRQGSNIRNGIPVAIAGSTNAGKSSLMNALVGDDRAIVSDIHGTTRDIVEDTIQIGDNTYRLMDTAGLRNTDDQIEKLGIERSHNAMQRAAVIIVVIDPTTHNPVDPLEHIYDTRNDSTIIAVINKTDVAAPQLVQQLTARIQQQYPTIQTITISAKNDTGIDQLRTLLHTLTAHDNNEHEIMISNIRHATLLAQAAETAAETIAAIDNALPPELIAQPLRQTIDTLGAITGAVTSHQILSTIFARFCIGK